MDVAEFALIRPSRRPDPQRTIILSRTMRGRPRPVEPPVEPVEPPVEPVEPPVHGGANLQGSGTTGASGHEIELIESAHDGAVDDNAPEAKAAENLVAGSGAGDSREGIVTEITAETFPTEYGSVELDPASPSDDGSVLARIYAIVRAVEAALAAATDRLTSGAVRTVAAATAPRDWGGVDWDALGGLREGAAAYELGRMLLAHHLHGALTGDGAIPERAVLLTRYALVAELLVQVTPHGTMTADEVRALMNDQPLVLRGLDGETVTSASAVKLIREASVRDLQVVRREWAGYLPGEIASVRNLMPGESFTQHDGTTRESETTQTSSKEQTEETIAETESKQQAELSSAVNTAIGVTVNGHADASAEFKYPVLTARISGGVDAGLSLQRSEQEAAKIAREAVAKATTRVETTTRESRTQRDLQRTEQSFDYGVRNGTGAAVHGVYRWVDRVDTYQLFRFTDRLQLEFQIPEPAAFYRWRTNRSDAAAAQVDAPPEWKLTLDQILPDKLVELAATYRATNLPAAPNSTLVIARPLTVSGSSAGATDAGDDDDKAISNPPASSTDLNIPIPAGYQTVKVLYQGEGYPVVGKWRNENYDEIKGTHSGFATVSVGTESDLYWNGGLDDEGGGKLTFYATHGDDTDVGKVSALQAGRPPYGRTFVPIGGDGTLFTAKSREIQLAGVRDSLVVSVSTLGLLSCSLAVEVHCELTKEETANWQLRVYDALFAAWSQWKRDHEANDIRDDLLGRTGAIDAGGTLRNDAVIREELKRAVIGWLLSEERFPGRPALQPAATDGPLKGFADIDVTKAIESAPTVQFLEQAFEWTNIAYVFYPYYWADRDRWEELSQLKSDDPEFERFLRAGTSRVIVPARQNFTDAVKNFLVWGRPFVTGRLPSPDSDLHVALETEIREISGPPTGGIAGEHWQTRMTTTMVYLEEDGDLPFRNENRTLPAAAGEEYVAKDVIPPSSERLKTPVDSSPAVTPATGAEHTPSTITAPPRT